MCLNPVLIKNKNWLNGSNIKYNTKYMQVSCRKCLECRQVRANEWSLLCMAELKNHSESSFITLTYADNPVVLVKKDIQNFIKRLRKKIHPKKIKYFLVGEYGERFWRPHFHVIIFGYDFQDKRQMGKSDRNHLMYMSKELSTLWKNGRAVIQDVTSATIGYSALYSGTPRNKLPKHLREHPEFNLMSQNLGVEVLSEKLSTYYKTDEIYLNGFAYKIPMKLLKKKYGVDSEEYLLMKYKRQNDAFNRNIDKMRYRIKTNNVNAGIEELETRERLLKNKKNHLTNF